MGFRLGGYSSPFDKTKKNLKNANIMAGIKANTLDRYFKNSGSSGLVIVSTSKYYRDAYMRLLFQDCSMLY